jgi:hypothetical protein
VSQIENLGFIPNNGIPTFVAAECRKWISEKGVYCVHDKQFYR